MDHVPVQLRKRSDAVLKNVLGSGGGPQFGLIFGDERTRRNIPKHTSDMKSGDSALEA